MFIYLMAYNSLAEREAQWEGFYTDDEWWRVRAATNAGEEMIERFDLLFLKRNPASISDRAEPGTRMDGVHELMFVEVAVGKTKSANDFLADHYLPAISAAGGKIMWVADLISGCALPKLAIIVGWHDAAKFGLGNSALMSNENLQQLIKHQRLSFGRPLFGRIDSYLLQPTPFDLPYADLGHDRLTS
jgi:hypothetical protein